MSVTACGVDVFVRDIGSGEPVLLLHGNPDSAEMWDGVIDRLKDRYRCIAIDLPGFARSRAPADFDCSLENLARFIDATVEAIGIREPLNLVAHDFGGSFAMSWAITYPQKVRRIVVINHSSFVDGFKWHWRARVWRTPLLGELSMLLTRWPLFRATMRAGARRLSEEQMRHAYERLSPQWRRMVLKLYRAADPEVREKWVPRTKELVSKVPTLVLWGEHDPFIPSPTADKFNARKIVRFPESGHWPPAEVPDKVAAELMSFFAGS